MTARAPISDASQRVLTDRKTLHAVSRLPGLERIPGSCDKVFEAEQSLTMRAQHGEACPCMDKDTHTQRNLAYEYLLERAITRRCMHVHAVLSSFKASKLSTTEERMTRWLHRLDV